MTQIQFHALCLERTIMPDLAVCNDTVIDAILSGDDEAVIEALDNEF